MSTPADEEDVFDDPTQRGKDGTPSWAYDDGGECVCCGNGRRRFHHIAPEVPLLCHS